MKKTTVCKLCDEPRQKGRTLCTTHIFEKEKEKKIKQREKTRAKKKREKKKESKSVLTKELDRVFSIYIRTRDKFICISCKRKGDLKSMQCGHFIRRSCMNTRWDEENCHCQCPRCNVFMGGNYPAYSLALMQKFGADIIEDLNERGATIRKWSKEELKEMIEKYKSY